MINTTTKILLQKDLDGFSISLRGDGIVQVDINSNEVMDVKHIKLGEEFLKGISDSNKFPLLFFVGEFSLPTDEARLYQAREESNPYASAEAYVINSLAQKLIGNFYLKFNKPVRPTKFFHNMEEAAEWLKEFL
jgi:hypothetical protein